MQLPQPTCYKEMRPVLWCSKVKVCETVETYSIHICSFFFFLHSNNICLTSSALQHKSSAKSSTTNINISNLLCCSTANRTDTTQGVLINHDYEAPLAAASLGSQRINSIPVLSVGTPRMMIQVVR